MKRDQQQQMVLSQIYNSISTLRGDAIMVDNTIIRLANEVLSPRRLLQEFSLVENLAIDNERYLNGIRLTYDRIDQEIEPLKRRSEDGQIVSFDGKLVCFRCPQREMNDAHGFENFISFEQIQQNQDRYVQNDTIFIKVEVDFLSVPPDNDIYISSVQYHSRIQEVF
jgi:hypothetical protein